MIEALFDIGAIQTKVDFLDGFIEDIGERNKHVFTLNFDISNGDNIFYKDIGYEEFSKAKKLKYFYKGIKGNGSNYTPTTKITDDIRKTFKTKVSKSVRNFINRNEIYMTDKDKKILGKVSDIFEADKANILNDLIGKVKDMGISIEKKVGDAIKIAVKDGGMITLVFIKDNNKLYVGDMDAFVQTIAKQKNSAYSGYYSKYGVESKSDNKQCYICHRLSEVWGFVDTYKFYTADKKGMVTGGFNQKLAWKNYPVCPDCAITLERGKKYIEKYLKSRFCRFNYFIIPQLVYPDKDILQQVLKRMKNYDNFSLGSNQSARIEGTEEKILKELSKEKNIVNFNFVFYKVSNSAFNILLHLKEIAPTRLAHLISVKYEVDTVQGNVDIFKEIPTKNGAIKFDFSFQSIRDFYNNNKIEGNFDKDFLSILNDIFIGKKIRFEFLLNRIMSKIRGDFLNGKGFNFDMLKAYKIILYLGKLQLLKRRRSNVKALDNPYEKFFGENSIFDDNAKKALFLEGVLAGKLLNIQYSDRNAKPFQSRLNGLKIDERVAKRLLPEMINKLEEYDKNYYRKMEESIGLYFVNSSFAKYSVDEMSFYFTLGLTLSGKFDKKENKEGKDE